MPTPYETALSRIQEAAQSGATELDLSRLGLTELPPKIGALTGLTTLNLSRNQLTSLPPEIGALTRLTTLDLRNNQLTSLPPEVWELPALKRLDISGNPLPGIPPEVWRKTDWEALGLAGLNLTSLPPEIGALTGLTTLYLGNNQLTSLPPEVWELPALKRLDISDNPLPGIPPEVWRKTDWEALALGWLNLTFLPLEIGALTRLTKLYLSGNRLTSLPSEIGALIGLTELYLSGNQLTSIPPEIGALTGLTKLYLSGNQLTSLPPEIGALTGLTRLDLSGNQLTSLPPEIGALTELTRLYLSGNQLTSLPPEIGALTELTKLNLWGNRLTSLPPEIGALTGLTELYLSGNRLTSLPPEIGALTGLTKLYLSGNQLTSLPPEIGALTELTKLYLSGNQLTSLPPEIGALSELTRLDLSGNQLISLSPEIGALTGLTELYLSGNQLTSLPPEIGALTGLTTLDLSLNRIASLPPEIGALTRLTRLDLSLNRIASLPPEIGALTRLTELYLLGNRLTSLPPEIGALTGLTTLILAFNRLTSLPPEIGQLANLQTLDLQNNQLTSLPPEIGQLANLQTLDLQNNQLTSLPPEIGALAHLERLNLHGNPLTLALPRALVEGSKAQEILRFYRAVWQEGRVLGEARLLFVGQPGVGKTSLVYRLKDGSFDPHRPSTMTVETHALSFNYAQGGVTARVWDFGGQDFMHATHPFFFSARCVYVLVLNVRQTYEQNRVEYWLKTIRAYGGESPVIVVGNHADAAQHVLDLPQNRLKGDFPQIAAFVQTSAAEKSGIEALRAALHQAIESLPHVRVLFARPHLAVKEALEREKETHDIIPYERYRALCAGQGITDEKDQNNLLALLHDLGVALDFRDEAGEPLCPDGVLNPNWVTNAVYRLITDQELRSAAAGRLTPEMTRRILQDYQPWHRGLILKLLQRFELAYPAPGGIWYLPNVMRQDEPAAASDSAWAGALTFEYAYPELLESVITRFIVRSHEFIEAGQVWRWGVILASGGNRALVRANAADKKVEIRVSGPENTRRDLLALVRGHFQVIHQTFQEGAGRENFPIQEFLCPPQYPGLRLDYHKLLTFERDGLAEIPETWQGRTIRLNVFEALNGFVAPEARRADRKRLFPEEERMEKEKDRVIRIDVHGNLQGGNIIIGQDNQVQQTIQGSFNAGLSPEVQAALAQLTAAVQEMLQHLPAEQAEEIRADLEHLQEELNKPKPNRKWYSVSIEGLIQAAKNVGAVGAPVIELAGKLLKLLM